MHDLEAILMRHANDLHPMLPFQPHHEKLLVMDFTAANPMLNDRMLSDIDLFTNFIRSGLEMAGARYGIGGYGEHRTVYGRSRVFDAGKPGEEPRRVHLGMDIWGDEGTPVSAPLGGMVHSLAFNNRDGDYGATIILLHQLDGIPFYSLYGHLSRTDLAIQPGQYISRGQVFAHFGTSEDNGNWPPHLHLQLIRDLGMHIGDYPGVCRFSERDHYLENCPDPDLLARLYRFVSNN